MVQQFDMVYRMIKMSLLFWIVLVICLFPCFFLPIRGQHAEVNDHIVISSFMNPLAKIPYAPLLNPGIVEFDYVDSLAFALNYSYEVKPPRDILAVGTMLENGTWTGAMGQIQRREVDVVVSLVTMTPLKHSVAEPSFPIFYEDTVIVIPYAKHQSNINIISPLSPMTWLVLFISMIIGSIVMVFTQRHLPHTKSFWVLAMLSTVGAVRVPYFGQSNKTKARLILTAYLFGLFLLRNYYVAEYTSMLTLPNRVFAFESIEDVAYQSEKVTVLVAKGSTSEEYFMTSNVPAIKTLGQVLSRYPERFYRYETELKAMYDRIDARTVLIQPRAIAEGMIYDDYLANGKKCRFTVAPKGFNPKAQGFVFPKGSHVSEAFSGEILDQLRFGMLEYFKVRIKWEKRQPCTTLLEGSPSEFLTMTNFIATFYLLVAGLSLSALVFLLELIVYYWNRIQEMNKRETSNKF